MARPKGRPKAKGTSPSGLGEQVAVITLKGSSAQVEWFKDVHRKTHIAKAVIVRLALDLWAKEWGLSPFPFDRDDH